MGGFGFGKDESNKHKVRRDVLPSEYSVVDSKTQGPGIYTLPVCDIIMIMMMMIMTMMMMMMVVVVVVGALEEDEKERKQEASKKQEAERGGRKEGKKEGRKTGKEKRAARWDRCECVRRESVNVRVWVRGGCGSRRTKGRRW